MIAEVDLSTLFLMASLCVHLFTHSCMPLHETQSMYHMLTGIEWIKVRSLVWSVLNPFFFADSKKLE